MISPRHKKAKAGYSMIEVAIVLGVTGLVIAAVWSAASYVRTYVRREQVIQQSNSFVNDLRTHYQNRATIDTATPETIDRLVARSVVPSEMVRDPFANPRVADHALAGAGINAYVANNQGSFQLAFADSTGLIVNPAAADGMMFAFILRDMSVENCVHVMTSLTGSKGPRGLVRVSYQGGNTNVFPIMPQAALPNCAGGWMGLAYQLRMR